MRAGVDEQVKDLFRAFMKKLPRCCHATAFIVMPAMASAIVGYMQFTVAISNEIFYGRPQQHVFKSSTSLWHIYLLIELCWALHFRT